MGELNYLSAMSYCSAVIGNSSSGILEAPIFHKPTVNIGNRQTGRNRTPSILDCDENSVHIATAIKKQCLLVLKKQLKNLIFHSLMVKLPIVFMKLLDLLTWKDCQIRSSMISNGGKIHVQPCICYCRSRM